MAPKAEQRRGFFFYAHFQKYTLIFHRFKEENLWLSSIRLSRFFRRSLSPSAQVSQCGVLSTSWTVSYTHLLEEIRKREERKDRLHQNYLKRKASGAQKRYEDKIKKRKKAEIEAKKAAIRAEDIAKGVFVPVSSLPQREPMKGVQTA